MTCSGVDFGGLDFLHAASSAQINGVDRDAHHVVSDIASRVLRGHATRTMAAT